MSRRANPRSWICTEFHFQVYSFTHFAGTEEQEAMTDWLQFHQIDASTVPSDAPIFRDPIHHRIIYIAYVPDEKGKPQLDPVDNSILIEKKVEQGEAGPLPWPAIILERAV
jgi:hypothetical protein